MDFEYTPTAPGLLVFWARPRASEQWRMELPIRVEP